MSKMVSVFIKADANAGYFGNIQFSQATAPKSMQEKNWSLSETVMPNKDPEEGSICPFLKLMMVCYIYIRLSR